METREDQSRNKGLVNQENSEKKGKKEALKVFDNDHPNPGKHGCQCFIIPIPIYRIAYVLLT